MKKILLMILLAFMMQGMAFSEDWMKVEIEGVKINVPLGWFAQYTGSPQLFFLYSPLEEGDTFQENSNLTIEKLPVKYSVQSYMKSSVENIKKIYKDMKVIESGNNYHIISGMINDISVQQIQYFYIKGNNAYVLTFSSTPENFDKFADTFKKIAESFVF